MLFRQFERYLKNRGLPAERVEQASRVLQGFAEWFLRHNLHHVRVADVWVYLSQAQTRPREEGDDALRALFAFFEYAARDERGDLEPEGAGSYGPFSAPRAAVRPAVRSIEENARRLLAVLRQQAGPGGIVTISTAELASRSKVPYGSVQRARDYLIQAGNLQILEPGKAKSPTVYRLYPPQPEVAPEPVSPHEGDLPGLAASGPDLLPPPSPANGRGPHEQPPGE